MSTQAVTSTPQPSTFEVIRNNLSKPGNWIYLIPTIGAIALGIIHDPNFTLGVGAGTALFATAFVAAKVIIALDLSKTDVNMPESAKKVKQLHDAPLAASLVYPVVWEWIYRGAVQPLATREILRLVPAAAAAFMGTGLSIARTVSAVAIPTILGSLNDLHGNNSRIWTLFSITKEIAYGLIAAQFGLVAAIATHIAHDTLSTTRLMLTWRGPPSSVTAL